MSKEIDFDAKSLIITEDAFEKFQSATSVHDEDEFITLSDIVPPQPTVPDLSQELNEIPYDNEVVLGSPQNDESQVNNHDIASQLLDISENSVCNEYRPDTSGEEYLKDVASSDLEITNSNPSQQKVMNYYERQDLSSDGLGAQNYVIEDSTSIIQDSLLSTTVNNSDTTVGTPSENVEATNEPRRTKRGRVPNTSKYPLTAVSDSNSNKNGKRRPGRPKKSSVLVSTLEPDSTNNDTSLVHENGVAMELHASNTKGRRGRSKASLTNKGASTPNKLKLNTLQVDGIIASLDENSVQSSNQDVDLETKVLPPPINDDRLPLGTSKRKKPLPKRGKKKSRESTNKLDNVTPIDNCITSEDDADDICLSQIKQGLKEDDTINNSSEITKDKAFNGLQNDSNSTALNEPTLTEDIESVIPAVISEVISNNIDSDISGSSNKRSSKMPIMSDFEYNVDKVVKNATTVSQTDVSEESQCLLVEDTSKRRRTVKKTFVYDEGSDEDPFANIESSEDESPIRRKKGKKYCSDDEYVPVEEDRKKGGGKIQSSSSESEYDSTNEVDTAKTKKKSFCFSPFKKGRKSKSQVSTLVTQPTESKTIVSTIVPKDGNDDIEGCLETTMIKIDEPLKPPGEAWATSNEFENFIAQKTQGTSLKIKKVSSKEITETLAPLDIPVIKQNEPKKTTEISTQTAKASTSSTCSQTSVPYDIPMKMNVNLTPGQSKKACEFLSSVVQTTVELGHLMSQKSEDFMNKKINTEHVTDTFKMDYCVRKSFLLFKLARHNLLQMEEDLSNQYEAFLQENGLSQCRDQPKNITPKAKEESDSDCEIVEVVTNAVPKEKQVKPKFNPKTVFLNKELSIKIAKKPTAPEKPAPGKKKLEIKGRHAVWINKNVMVKKVSASQSFLAQDSRNKKPPDNFVTEKMVSDFFDDYYRSKAIFMCAPFINTDWTHVRREYACHYFVNELNTANTLKNATDISENNIETPDENRNFNEISNIVNPKSLCALCIDAVRLNLQVSEQTKAFQKIPCDVTDGTNTKEPVTLFRLCINVLRADLFDNMKLQEDTLKENNLADYPPECNKENSAHALEEINDSNQHESFENSIYDEYVVNNHDMLFQKDVQGFEGHLKSVSSLTSICYQQIVKLIYKSETFNNQNNLCKVNNTRSLGIFHSDIIPILEKDNMSFQSDEKDSILCDDMSFTINGCKSLITLCVELIQSLQGIPNLSIVCTSISSPCYQSMYEPKSLKSIVLDNIKQILYPSCTDETCDSALITELNCDNDLIENFTINSVNTLTEEAFQSLQVPMGIRIRKQSHNSSNFSDGYDNDNCGLHEQDFNEGEDNGWASQLQVHEFRTCTPAHVIESTTTEINETTQEEEEPREIIRHIKAEPIDYFPEENIVDTSIVKTEPIQALHELNEMTHIQDSVVTKKELVVESTDRDGSPLIHKNSSYNVETFEQFVKANKMIQYMDESNDEIFSQSALRIRRQHEPDPDQGNDMGMSLLVPHTFEPLHLVEAKGSLMESSSDDEGNNQKKNLGKKKDKKKKKQKKDVKVVNNKDTSAAKEKEKTVPENEVKLLTRRMREKIRQEEKKIESSDSDSENLTKLSSKKDKTEVDVNDTELPDSNIKGSVRIKLKKSSKLLAKDEEVQCNNVDSTETVDFVKTDKKSNNFTGFSVIDQNEITNYQKLMQFVYDKIIPADNEIKDKSSKENTSEDFNDSNPVINPNDPVELLECEPTMPDFESDPNEPTGPKKSKKNKKKLEVINNKPQYTDRNGWHCYPIHLKETKLYKAVQIKLEKLPETFVQTYMEYQDVMKKDSEDQEVDRLINLQSLSRSISINNKDAKTKSRSKAAKEFSTTEQDSDVTGAESPTYSDNLDELPPSDDEGPAVEDEIPPPIPARSSENNLAKNLLMDDHDSDSDSGKKKIKQELQDHNDETEKLKKPGPKAKTIVNKLDSETLMLTADRMMNKELNLLHAPVLIQEHTTETKEKETSPKEESKSKRNSTRHHKDRVKNEDDSSSEEEKQWVSTKEKLLKRMGKKDNAIADDAKRAKIVNEFIERRNESERKSIKRESCVGRKGLRRRKALERQKQLRFLSNELYNEGDGVIGGKRGAAAGLFKGRRNIRKVIDKKSLARSTVVANMEEFERKRKLNLRQSKLREVLGCEEDVNVLVINDEVCLEYDFVEQRPVVTVHQFFTKVMKAHQYEGVKFMWDACFESLGTIESGHRGGGCILAHCMGLGKTLQVLALLHTVLTNPRANMHRVLVCCPLSTVLNWVDEINKWIGPVTNDIKVFELSKLRKTYERAYQLEDWYNGGGIFIIGYELFRSLTTLDPEIDEIRPTIINKIRTALLDPGPDIIVCDEGHLLKNDCSVLAVAMSRVVTKRRIILTGTPMQNNLREYFCMVNFIKPNLLGTYSEYSNRFENPIMNGQHRDSVDEDIKLMKARTHILHKVLEGCLQRQEASVLYPYLPKKHEYTVFIPLTKCQWDLYHHYINHYTRTNCNSKPNVLRDFHVLQKIWSHPQVLHSFQMKARDKKDKIKAEKIEDDLALADQEADIKPTETEVWWLQYLCEGAMLDSLDSSNKFVAVFRILHECIALGDKVLIFSTSLFCLDALEYFLKKINQWSLGQEYYRLDGSVPAEVRQKWCREFNADNNVKTKLFLISTRAGCLGLNMTAANRVIILDTSWNPAHDIQSIFRVYRFGQKKDCYIYRLVALGTMEQKIYERSVTKQAVACRVVDEQQIDRHYNLAELTELYSVDELGQTVAGGVAVGVGDVALLRVARDVAIHAVHEHDSLLRGSAEQGLPEHERAAAWTQFQQEHEHKQMQNELHANQAVKAMKRLEMEHLRQQALSSENTDLPPSVHMGASETEPPTEYPLIVPKEEELAQCKSKGKKGRPQKIIQCRIPITSSTAQPGPSQPPPEPLNQQELVKKITTLLIKHNFMEQEAGPKQISELVAKVKKMVMTKQPMALGPGYDELSTSIAEVLLHGDVTTPELKDSEKLLKKNREKPNNQVEVDTPPVTEEIDGRRRRKAALTAERQFELQQEVIDLDDDQDDWQNDEVLEPLVEPAPGVKKTKQKPKEKTTETYSSIVLSDEDAEVNSAPINNDSSEEEVPLHPSLLTNSNFIKIVAHTYLSCNPMMDEDAATLAAQYSTLKTLKEAESEGKPIVSGAVYDIAVKVLGKSVLTKLHAANPKTSGESIAASTQLQSFLTEKKPTLETSGKPETPAPAPASKKPKIGPKSKIMKEVQAPKSSQPETTKNNNANTINRANNTAATSTRITSAPTLREESILPDEQVVLTGTEATAERKPIMLRRVKIDKISMLKPAPATPVALGRGPAPVASATICLDSDDEEPPAPRAPPAPVPVALTGPNARPIPLPMPSKKPMFFTLSPCGTRAIPLTGAQPIALSAGLQPVPVTLLGPGVLPMMMSVPAPAPQAGPSLVQPVPVSLVGPDSRPIPLSGPAVRAAAPKLAPAPQPAPVQKPAETKNRTVAFVGGQNPLAMRFSTRPIAPAPSPRAAPQPTATVGRPSKTTAKPGDTLTIGKTNRPVILNHSLGQKSSDAVTHTIVDVAQKPAAVAEDRRPRRRSSSSSSSGGSRASTPDPLAILRDVVHIQAPNLTTKNGPVNKTKQLNYASSSKEKQTILGRPKADSKGMGKAVATTVDLAAFKTKKPISASVDLTGSSAQGRKDSTKITLSSEPNLSLRIPSSRLLQEKTKFYPPSTSSKLIGTSILDGKSKSLKVDKSASPSIMVTSTKTTMSLSKQKPIDKRPATSYTAPAPKKKKTELMTLKDFDIDDIDGIIELD